jgi:hypothetical protein
MRDEALECGVVKHVVLRIHMVEDIRVEVFLVYLFGLARCFAYSEIV